MSKEPIPVTFVAAPTARLSGQSQRFAYRNRWQRSGQIIWIDQLQ